MIIKIYVVSSIFALLSSMLIIKRVSELYVDKYELKKVDHFKGKVTVCIRLGLMCLIPIYNILVAILYLKLFIFSDDEELMNIFNLKDKIKARK